MKLSVFDRMLLFFSMLFMLAIGVGIALVCTSITSFVEIAKYIEVNLYGPSGIAILVAVSAVIIFISIKLILSLFISPGSKDRVSHEARENIVLKDGDDGNIMVSPELVKDIAVRYAKKSDDVKDVECKIICEENGVKILMKFYLKRDIVINEFLSKMQEELKDYVEKYVGININSVDFCADFNGSNNSSGRVK